MDPEQSSSSVAKQINSSVPPPHTERSPTDNFSAQEYYATCSARRPGLSSKFKDIDDAANYQSCRLLLQDARTKNFVLDFGNDDAWCAVDLSKEDFAALMDGEIERPKIFGTRWINIWAPETQKDIVRYVAERYGLSYRLIQMMCTEPIPQTKSSTEAPDPPPRPTSSSRRRSSVSTNEKPAAMDDDLENARRFNDLHPSIVMSEATSLRDLTFSHIINQIWHFCSVDYGRQYTCIGYNALYTVKINGKPINNGKDRPDGKRIWCWIVLCSDGTVISIQENPFPGPYRPTAEEEKIVVGAVRRNIISVFSGASKQHSADKNSQSLVNVRVRYFSDSPAEEASISQSDGPSLVMYYIFDDWVSSYRLVAQREHMYGASLDELRKKMLDRPKVDLVDDLHWIGRRLAVLKRLYQSYELVMTRILQRQRLLRDEARERRDNHPSLTNALHEMDSRDTIHSRSTNTFVASEYDTVAGVLLSSAAVGRFERLTDRIKLYCLDEIEACLTEKESLTFMNFNLIALKDSQAMEKLTRITVLLAKVTILFLPVSLMTGYFGVEIADLQETFSGTAYWISFAVIMFLSAVALIIFGYASDTVEGKTIYQSLFRAFFQSSKDKLTRRRR